MHFSLAKVGAFAALLASHVGAASIVSRQQVTVESVLQALRGAQLNNLANALQSNPEVVQDVLRSPGAKTLFAPNDAAMSALPPWTTNNKELLQSTLLMHVLNGTFDRITMGPQHTVGHSFLTNPKYSNLPGGNGAAIALGSGQNRRFIQEAVNTDLFTGEPIRVGDLTVQVVDRAATIPGNTTFTLGFLAQYRSLVDAIAQTSDLAATLDNMRGSTLFAPSTEALASYMNRQQIPADQLPTILRQHVLVNRAAYSPLLEGQGTLVNAAGQNVIYNREQNTVSVGNSTARITQYDVMTKGGVIHLIDSVLASTEFDEERANQAAESAARSANSYVAGPVNPQNAASSQGPNPPSCDTCRPSTIQTNDASGGSGAAPGTPGAEGSATSGVTGTDGNGGTSVAGPGTATATGTAPGATGTNGSGGNGNGGQNGNGQNGNGGSNGTDGSNGAVSSAAPYALALSLAALSAVVVL